MRLAIATLGCKTNSYESAAIAAAFPKGWILVGFEEPADIYIINTCTVTGRTDFKSRNLIRKALAHKAINPAVKVVVTGCFAQRHPMDVASLGAVDLIVDNQSKVDIWNILNGATNRFQDASQARGFRYTPVTTMLERSRAFQKIQDGCGLFCAYCAVSHARGPSRSAHVDEVLKQAKLFVENGYREIVLGGVNLGLYRDGETGLSTLISQMKQIEGLELLRLSSLEPQLVNESLLSELATGGIYCPHLHLSLQSGSETVLKRMGRRYTARSFEQLVSNILRRIPDAAIGVDVIVGFPGETEQEFAETLSLLQNLPLAYMHVFSYSKRPGTPAATMPGQIAGPVRKQRSAELLKLSDSKTNSYRNMLLDKGVVLRGVVESVDKGIATLLTDHYIRAYTGDRVECGSVVSLRPSRSQDEGLVGSLISL